MGELTVLMKLLTFLKYVWIVYVSYMGELTVLKKILDEIINLLNMSE